MRLISVLPALALLPSLLAQSHGRFRGDTPAPIRVIPTYPSPDGATLAAIEAQVEEEQAEAEAEVQAFRTGGGGGGGKPKPKPKQPCEELDTRDPKTCACKPGLLDTENWCAKRDGLTGFDVDGAREILYARAAAPASAKVVEARTGGGKKHFNWPKEECICPDSPNTDIKWNKGKASCSCPGPNQVYDPKIGQCKCTEVCWAKRDKHNKLTCTPPGPEPSGKTYQPHRRSFKEAVRERKRGEDGSSRVLEDLLKCDLNEQACETSSMWKCTDVMSTLATCGGCAGEAVDCAAIANVDEVRCVKGGCIIDSCLRGFHLSNSSSTPECVPSPSIQGHVAHFAVQGSSL